MKYLSRGQEMIKANILLKTLMHSIVFASILVTSVMSYPEKYDSVVARRVVDSLDIIEFKAFDKGLADLGGREYGSQSNRQAKNWIVKAMEDLGYDNVKTQSSTYNNVYCTKVGSISPDSMYIVSAHYDGMKVAQAANDNASGCALVLEGARVFVDPLIKTHYSPNTLTEKIKRE